MVELKRYVNPLFWQEKTIEYFIQDEIKPSIEIKLRALGTLFAAAPLYLAVVPFIYSIYKKRNPETIDKMWKNIRKSLSDKGFSLDEWKYV